MQSTNPFEPPKAEVRSIEEPAVEVPAPIQKQIKTAWVAGLVSASITLVFSMFRIQGFELLNLIDVALMLGLTYGIYRKSRVCAVLMLLYFVASKIIVIAETGQASGIFMALFFLYFYWQGVAGTFAYSKIVKASKKSRRLSDA